MPGLVPRLSGSARSVVNLKSHTTPARRARACPGHPRHAEAANFKGFLQRRSVRTNAPHSPWDGRDKPTAVRLSRIGCIGEVAQKTHASCPGLSRASTPCGSRQLRMFLATARVRTNAPHSPWDGRDKPTTVRLSRIGCIGEVAQKTHASCPGLSRASTPCGSRQLRKFLATARRGWPGQARPRRRDQFPPLISWRSECAEGDQ